jgi:hypothetical protein
VLHGISSRISRQENKNMFQPQVPLITLDPQFRAQRLGEIELGRLVLLTEPSGGARAGIGVRADTLSARGETAEGVLRLAFGPVRFERRGLDEPLLAIEIDYVLEAELESASARALESGDLVVSPTRPPSGLFVANAWPGTDGILDIASAIIRPCTESRRSAARVAMGWSLVERGNRQRVLLRHYAPHPAVERVLRPALSEECD